MKFSCDDGNAELVIEADDAEEAAQEYVDSGEWGDRTKTEWVDVRVVPLDNDEEPLEDECPEIITITLDPNEPGCESPKGHDWQNPIEVVGGLKENPGVYGHGGGVTITEVCSHCARYRIIDTWAQNPENGKEGLESTEYREADDESIAWINRHNH